MVYDKPYQVNRSNKFIKMNLFWQAQQFLSDPAKKNRLRLHFREIVNETAIILVKPQIRATLNKLTAQNFFFCIFDKF